jgi:hypothetical protein
MGYRDNFYVVENIRGYTGALYQRPTVYFQSNAEEGRITQVHEDATNVGRNVVRPSAGYEVKNAWVPGEDGGPDEFLAVEFQDGEARHISRNVLILASTCDQRGLDMLAQAIYRCTEIKQRHRRYL